MNTTKKGLFFAATVLFAYSLGMLAYSYWTAEKSTDNFLTMASYKANIIEEYAAPAHVDPAQKIKKKVQVQNKGTVDILVRVSVSKEFGTRDKNGVFRKDPSLNTDVIEIEFNRTSWMQKDGWFYYKDVLKAGETTKEPLMEAYTLSKRAGNEYKGKEAQIVVCMESVQAEGDAISAWDISCKDLGIERPSDFEARSTKVTFCGKRQGFRITAENTDLFASFKNLVPGCARTQRVVIENTSGEEAELFLRARESSQGNLSAKQRALVAQLLQTYAMIEVRQGERLLYRGAVCGEDEGDSMREQISLGKFEAGSQKELTVSLSLSPKMDNQFQKLTGKVTWVFSALGEDGQVIEQAVPKTGDDTQAVMWAALFAASGAALTAALGVERRNKRKHCMREEQNEMFKMDR